MNIAGQMKTRFTASASTKVLTLVPLVVVLTVLLGQAYRYISYVALVFPLGYGEYGEGIVWQQALLIPGARMYGDIDRYPFIVFHYPPLYHLVVRLISSLGLDMLMVGRGISVASTVGVAALVAVLTYRAANPAVERTPRLLVALVAALTLFVWQPVVFWSAIMRVDMLGLALTFAGVLLVVCSIKRPSLLYAAMVSFVLAVYTKQTLVAAPVASLAVLLFLKPRFACKGIAFGIALGLLALAYLEWATEGGFLKHVLIYNMNPSEIWNGLGMLVEQSQQAIYLLLVLLSVIVGWLSLLRVRRRCGWSGLRMRLSTSESALITAIFTLYFLISAAMLSMIFKQGAAINYFIECMSVGSVLIGLLLNNILSNLASNGCQALPTSPTASVVSLYVVTALVAVQALFVPLPPTRSLTSPETARSMAELLEMVRATSKPVLSDDMVTLLRAGQEVPLEPAIFAALARMGTWDQRPLIDLIQSHAFAFIVTENAGPDGTKTYLDRYTGPVRGAIALAYPHDRLLNRKYTLRMP